MRWTRARRSWSGFSIPVIGGGASWRSSTDEREVVRNLAISFGERRALTAALDCEDEEFVNASILEVRKMLTDALRDLQDGSEASRLLTKLRDACNKFLTDVGPAQMTGTLRPAVVSSLVELRESFRVTFSYMGSQGELCQASALAERIPYGDPHLEIGRPVRIVEAPDPLPPSGRHPT